MRFRGREYTGAGVRVAVVDSGMDPSDPRLEGSLIEGWSLQLSATGHAQISHDFRDLNGHGTDVAAAIRQMAPEVEFMAVRILDAQYSTSADLMVAGIETALRNGAQVINLSLGTPNMGKALLLRDACAMAVEAGAIVLASGHPRGERVYPADLPETLGVTATPDCPLEKFFYFSPQRFEGPEFSSLRGKFMTCGRSVDPRGIHRLGDYQGPELATAYISGRVACIRQALPSWSPSQISNLLMKQALTPFPELGYR